MKKLGRFSFVIAALFTFVPTIVFSQTKEQTSFQLEESIADPTEIPADVIAVLKSDERVDVCFRSEGAGSDERSWFEAAAYDLNNDKRPDLIIKPKNSCLFGANQGPFWVFLNRTDGYQQVLSADGLALTILPRKGAAFSPIVVSKVVAMKPHDTQFRFSQGKYRPTK